MRGGIVVDDLCVNPDGPQRLAQIVAELARLLEARRRQETDLEARAARSTRIASLVEKRIGAPRIEPRHYRLARVELRIELRNGTCRRLGVAQEDGVDDELPVDRMGDGASHPRIRDLLAAVVDLDGELVSDSLVALGDNLDAGYLADALEIRQRHRRERGELNSVRLECRCNRRAVGQDLVDDTVEVRPVAFPIIRIALQPVELAGSMFDEPERARAHELGVGGVRVDIG